LPEDRRLDPWSAAGAHNIIAIANAQTNEVPTMSEGQLFLLRSDRSRRGRFPIERELEIFGDDDHAVARREPADFELNIASATSAFTTAFRSTQWPAYRLFPEPVPGAARPLTSRHPSCRRSTNWSFAAISSRTRGAEYPARRRFRRGERGADWCWPG
jgi:hypothetical protein